MVQCLDVAARSARWLGVWVETEDPISMEISDGVEDLSAKRKKMQGHAHDSETPF